MMSKLTEHLADLRADARSANVSAAVFVGAVTGMNAVIIENALGALVFTGQFEPYVLQGTGLFLFGTFVLCLVIALTSGYRGSISAPPISTTMTIAAIVATMGAQGASLFPTTVATLVIAGVGSGLCFLAIGQLRLANVMQFIPFPVSCGFLAGTGAEVCVAALSMMGLKLDWQVLPRLFEPQLLWNWLPGLGYALAMMVIAKRWRHVLVIPASFVGVSVLYHLGMAQFGVSVPEARELGLLYGGMAEGDMWPPMGISDLALVDWTAVVSQIPNIITVILITLICVLMNVNGLEVATNTELDWNSEFKSSGLASVLSGLGGGPPGCVLIAGAMRSRLFQAETWLTGVFAAVVIALCLFAGGDLLKVVPIPFMAAMVFVTGFAMVRDWLVKNRKRLPGTDYGIVVLIVVAIVAFGFLEGVALGMMVTAAFFAVRLSRVNLVESEYTSSTRQSTKARSIPDLALLREEGDQIRVYHLRGYIFFGSAHRLIDRLKAELGGDPRPTCVLLDFSAVSGVDLSAVNALCRFIRYAQTAETQVVLSAASEPLQEGLRLNLPPPAHKKLLFGADVDEALEQCEDLVIASKRQDSNGGLASREALLDTVAVHLEGRLDRLILFENLMEELQHWLEPREFEAGEALVTKGEVPEGLQFLTKGRVSVYDSGGTRISQFVPGDAIEPKAAFVAEASEISAIGDKPCQTLILTPKSLQGLERDEQQLALKLYRYLLAISPGSDIRPRE